MESKYFKILRFTHFAAVLMGILGALIALIVSTGIFSLKAIDQKYCYIINTKNIKTERVYLTSKKEDAYKIYKYYRIDRQSRGGIVVENNMKSIPDYVKVDVLKYTNDSLLAKIRVEWEERFTYRVQFYKKIGYVPTYTLHDEHPDEINLK